MRPRSAPARSGTFLPSLALVLATLVALSNGGVGQDPAKSLRAKDVAERLEAVEALRTGGDPKGEKWLLGALSDEDWAVVEAAAAALGEVGADDALEELVELAVDGPARPVRAAAARAAASIDADAALAGLAKAVGGKQGARACAAVAIVAPLSESDAAAKALGKALRSKDPALRRAAAGALSAIDPESPGECLLELASDPDLAVQCAALDGVAAAPHPLLLPALGELLARPRVVDVVERRLLRAVAATVARTLSEADGGERVTALFAGLRDGPPEVAARRMRLVAAVAVLEEAEALADVLAGELESGLDHADAAVRAAALHAGAGLGSDAVLAAALSLAREDAEPRVRRTALRALADHRRDQGEDQRPSVLCGDGVDAEAIAAIAVEVLVDEPDAGARELAAVALAARELIGLDLIVRVREALAAATADEDWRVAVCAAVSLGRVGDLSSVATLDDLLKHDDWRRRGAAVVGLARLNRPEVVASVITALEDPEPAVGRTAWGFLRAISRTDLPVERGPWERWWAESPDHARFVDAAAERERRERYGYAAKTNEELFETVFQELDVIVLESRGDHIQSLLERLSIVHRMTSAAKIGESALHPSAVYVSNCTGEVEPADIERLQWFVTTGGYLFGSCWSLSQTIERVTPGVVRKFETSGEVSDTVEAEPVRADSRWLDGVFGGGVRPLYELAGSHLIEVLDPERAEVLIDSPECAGRWGNGNLAVWFRSGHGLILDSANHFDLQGLENAVGLKKELERQAYAVERLGLTYEELRAVRDESWWRSNTKAARFVSDYSAFRFLTNFVRHKRLYEE